jgi:hypothetical protein
MKTKAPSTKKGEQYRGGTSSREYSGVRHQNTVGGIILIERNAWGGHHLGSRKGENTGTRATCVIRR